MKLPSEAKIAQAFTELLVNIATNEVTLEDTQVTMLRQVFAAGYYACYSDIKKEEYNV